MKTLTKTTLLVLGAVAVFGASDSANARRYHHYVVVQPDYYYVPYGYGYHQGPVSALGNGIANVFYSL